MTVPSWLYLLGGVLSLAMLIVLMARRNPRPPADDDEPFSL